MRVTPFLLLILACGACTKPLQLPPALSLTSELQGDPHDQSVRSIATDMYFQRFDGNYPVEWPQEFVLPKDMLLNHGGQINRIGGSMTYYLVATGVLPGTRRQVLKRLLAGLEAPEKKRGKLAPAEPAQFMPRQWAQTVEFRTYTDSGKLDIRVVDNLPNHPGLCLFQLSLGRSLMPMTR